MGSPRAYDAGAARPAQRAEESARREGTRPAPTKWQFHKGSLGALGVVVMLPASMRNGLRVGVVGVGGAGGNVLCDLPKSIPNLCRSLAINTHEGALIRSNADRKILVSKIQNGPIRSDAFRRQFVRDSARSAISEISEAVAGLDMALLVAGMGGVAGTEISTIVAQVLRKQNIFTIGFPILPFDWEGRRRNEIARYGAAELGRHVHSLFLISNDTFAKAASENATMGDVFSQASLSILRHYHNATRSVAASGAGSDLFV